MLQKRSVILVLVGLLAGALLMALLGTVFKSCNNPDETLKTSKTTVIADQKESDGETVVSDEEWKLQYPARNMSGSCILSGRIMDVDSRPLKNAVVRLRLLDEPWISSNVDAEAVTGKSGDYKFDGLTSRAKYQIFAYARGFATAGYQEAVCGAKTDLYLEKGAVLRLRFVNSEGNSVPFANVSIGGSSLWPNREARANIQGLLELPGLSAGFYSFTADKDNLGFTLLDPIELEAGDEVELEAQLVASKPLSITVNDFKTGKPVNGALVTVIPEGAPLIVSEYLSDSSGMVTLKSSGVAGSNITVSAPGYLQEQSIGVLPGNSISVSLKKGGVISGVVQTSRGERISGALVNVRVKSGGGFLDILAGQRQFRTQRFKAETPGRPVSIKISDTGMLAGPPNIPVPGLSSDTFKSAEKQEVQPWQPSNENGEFLIDGLPDGELSIGASHQQFVVYRRPRVTVSQGGRLEGIPVIMKRGVTLVLRAVSRGGHPVENTFITVFDMEGEVLKTSTTGSDGYVTVAGLPGEFKIEAAADQFVPVVRRILGSPGQTADVTVNLPDADKMLKGAVVNRLGEGIPGVQIEARLDAKGLSQLLTTESQSDGSFVLEGAARGSYLVKALINGEVRARASSVSPGGSINLVVENSDNLNVKSGVSNLASLPVPTRSEVIALTEPSAGLSVPGSAPPSASFTTGQVSTSYGDADGLIVTSHSGGTGGLPVTLANRKGKVVITGVGAGSQVAVTGLKKNAVLLKVDGQRVKSAAAAKRAIKGRVGSVVMLDVIQNGEMLSVVVQRVP